MTLFIVLLIAALGFMAFMSLVLLLTVYARKDSELREEVRALLDYVTKRRDIYNLNFALREFNCEHFHNLAAMVDWKRRRENNEKVQ